MNFCFSYYRICLLLYLIFIKCLNVLFFNLYLFGLKVFFVILKIFFIGVDVVGIDRYFVVSLFSDGNFKEFFC